MANKRKQAFQNYSLGLLFIGAGLFTWLSMAVPQLITPPGLAFTTALGIIGAVMANRAVKQMER